MENTIVDAFIPEAIQAGADDVDPETNTIKFVAVKR